MAQDRGPITLPNLMVCEGPDDVAFFHEFIVEHKLPRFCIRDTAPTRGDRGGNGRFGHALSAMRGGRGFNEVRKLLIVSDKDVDPIGNFSLVRNQLNEFFAGSAVLPQQPNEIVQAKGNLRLAILMIPMNGKHGHLEEICAAAAGNVRKDISAMVSHFASEAGVDEWDHWPRQRKMWLRTYLATMFQADPFADIPRILKEDPALIPLRSPTFRPIKNFLEAFCA